LFGWYSRTGTPKGGVD